MFACYQPRLPDNLGSARSLATFPTGANWGLVYYSLVSRVYAATWKPLLTVRGPNSQHHHDRDLNKNKQKKN